MEPGMIFKKQLQDHQELFAQLENILPVIIDAGNRLSAQIKQGGKILICGNGGSASDAQHLAAELVGRFEKERRAIPGISLSTDTSILTCLGNDYGYEEIFSRQVEALGGNEDILVAISTSGNSRNIVKAVEAAKRKKLSCCIGLLGRDGGELAAIVDIPVVIPHAVTARIQEAHIFIIHFWAGMVESSL